MSLLVILMIGVVIGWASGFVVPRSRRRDAAADMAMGAAGACVFGAMAGDVALLDGVTTTSLVAAAIGALLLVALAHGARRTSRRMRDRA